MQWSDTRSARVKPSTTSRLVSALAVAILIFVSGCASGHLVHEPSLSHADAASAARVFILRTAQIPGAANIVPVELDGTTVAELGGGEYVELKVNPGPHVVTTATTNREETQRLVADPNGRYFFEFAIVGDSKNIHQIDQREGERKIASGEYERLTR